LNAIAEAVAAYEFDNISETVAIFPKRQDYFQNGNNISISNQRCYQCIWNPLLKAALLRCTNGVSPVT